MLSWDVSASEKHWKVFFEMILFFTITYNILGFSKWLYLNVKLIKKNIQIIVLKYKIVYSKIHAVNNILHKYQSN